ncbi:glutamine--fructose-6-phosphate transaminase (isomerizing) [Natronoarchaeum rubrum]|uniref:glutamine--fructose-6-phosphate transaminase (isomerizing) n=1 Tax=Natronoarchaeum rubrum TaxID=755311 RepID=UPI0021127137|nr:glutamine--fructose-6-phosphate transaminase (isomerizing) [Natronoarchaeum rubrum]
MCGIIARAGRGDAVPLVLSGLENLEYRGYDSAGVAVRNGDGIDVYKRSGEVSELSAQIRDGVASGNVGIGHTRWSTHGPPTDANAHPHTDGDGEVAVVHNGIIENHEALRERLADLGCEFTSDTDTEVVPHLFEHYLERSEDAEAAFRRTVRDLEGSYAIAAIVDGEEAVYGARQGSPLVLGVAGSEYFLASDVPAFLEHTDTVVYLEDDDVAVLRPDSVGVTDLDGGDVARDTEHVDWDPEETGKGKYSHYMLKEINVQPTSLANTIEGRIDAEDGEVSLEEFPPGAFEGVSEVQLVACGTSYHAALYGQQLLQSAGINASAYRASEYGTADVPVTERTLVIGVTQSGETADTLGAIRRATDRGARTLAVTNVVGSTAARECDDALFIRAGPEIGVAATKTFTSQAVTLALLARRLAVDVPHGDPRDDFEAVAKSLERLPDALDRMLSASDAREVGRHYLGSDAFFFIGRGRCYPVALEGALKFKEITYEHAEGFASGELKHGPLSLVTPNTPVFAVFGGDQDEKTLKNASEAQTRGADVVAVASQGHPAVDAADAHLTVPDVHPVWAGLLANVQLQLVSYHTANQLDRAIDKPRNLAKSVTVE